MRHLRKFLWRKSSGLLMLTACVLPILLGCTMQPIATPDVALTFANRPAINLDVAKIDIVNAYRMPLKPPQVEHLMPIAPGAGVERWALDVLRAAGIGNTAVLTIRDASVTEVALKQPSGLKALLTVDQAYRYDGRVQVSLAILDSSGQQRGQVEVEVTRSQSVPEDITLNDRSTVWFKMVESLLADFASQIDAQARQDLGALVR